MSMQPGESASNVGQTHQRYTLAGDWYSVTAVDSGSVPVTDYQLNASVQVCIPLPDSLKTSIDDVVVVATISGSESFTVLSSRVRLSSDDSKHLCGNLSAIPADIAAAKRGAPDALAPPDSAPIDASQLPDTGGYTLPKRLLVFVGTFGVIVLLVGAGHSRRRRNR